MTCAMTCDWHPHHVDGRPTGPRCGAPATHRILWLDGSRRFSFGCDDHLVMTQKAPPYRIERICADDA